MAQENPQVPLLQVVAAFSFRFLVVMPFAGFSGIIVGESPVINNSLHFFNIMLYFYSLYISNGAKVI